MARFKKYSGRRSAHGIELKGEWVIAAVQADLDAAQEILRDPDQPDSERWLVLQVQKHGTDELKEIAVKATPADTFDSTFPPVGKTFEMVLSTSEFDPDAPDNATDRDAGLSVVRDELRGRPAGSQLEHVALRLSTIIRKG